MLPVALNFNEKCFGFKSKETIILSVFVEKGIVLWWSEDGKKTISPNFGWWINLGELTFE